MKKTINVLGHLILIGLLTILTQIGGIAYGLFLLVRRVNYAKKPNLWVRYSINCFLFLSVYCFLSFIVVPPVAKSLGRIPLQAFSSVKYPIRPVNWLTVAANRHYVKPELKMLIETTVEEMKTRNPAFRLLYLDANFPFADGFPLLPHLSHNDGKKLDLAFFYKKVGSNEIAFGESPSWLGYGVCELPEPGAFDQAAACAIKGFRYYSLLKKLTPVIGTRQLELEASVTAEYLNLLTGQPKLKKIFLEPHLKTRLGLQNNPKIRFHGCHAVRHDDHFHLEIN